MQNPARGVTSTLTGAQELRNGVVKGPTPNTASPDTVRAMTPEMFFDHLAVHINGEKAGNAKSVFNIDLGSDGGKYKLELEKRRTEPYRQCGSERCRYHYRPSTAPP